MPDSWDAERDTAEHRVEVARAATLIQALP